jgi:hypothetical protein
MRRLKHWWHLMRAGYRAVPAIISYVVLVVGGSVALAFTWGASMYSGGLSSC